MATAINVDVKATKAAIGENDIKALAAQAASAVEKLENGTGEGSDFLGWMHLPSSIQPAQLDQIEAVAAHLRHNCDYVVAIGIGGSYLGAKAVIEALSSSFAAYSHDGGTQVLFAGNNIAYPLDEKVEICIVGKPSAGNPFIQMNR